MGREGRVLKKQKRINTFDATRTNDVFFLVPAGLPRIGFVLIKTNKRSGYGCAVSVFSATLICTTRRRISN